jgi:vacuolar-type H+-ATPase subunit I/STV1
MPELAQRIMQFKPEPDPMQQKLQELEIMKLQKEIEKIDSEIQKNLADASKKASEKDKADLDFVEQESGVTHARNLEQTQAQGRANQDLVVTKALTTPRKAEEKDPDIEAAVGFNALTDVRDQEIAFGGA